MTELTEHEKELQEELEKLQKELRAERQSRNDLAELLGIR